MPRIRPKSPNAQRVPWSRLIYNTAAARPILPNGRFMSTEQMYRIIDEDNDACGVRMVQHGERLKQAAQRFKDGLITQDAYHEAVRAWGRQHAAEVKAVHYGNAAAARGGFHNFSQADHGALGGRLRVQYAYVNNLMIEAAANPDIVLSMDKSRRPFDERLTAYALSARETYEAFREDEEMRAGYEWEVNVESPEADHCKPSRGRESCRQQTEKGAVPVGSLVRVGRRACAFKCRCQVKRFKTKTAAEAWLKEMAA